jgi:hypothetical protein
VDWLPLLGFYFGFFPLVLVDPTGHRETDCGEGETCDPYEPPLPTPQEETPEVRAPIELEPWENQLLAIAAFVEMHGHGRDQAVAIMWVILNRMAGKTSLIGGSFHPNPNLREISPIASYVLAGGQMAVSEFLAEQYGLLKAGGSGDWEPIEGMTIEQVVSQAYERLNNFYSGELDAYIPWANEVIADYNSGASDPTEGAVWYGHVPPDRVNAVVANLEARAELLGLSNRFTHHVFRSDIGGNSLIVNNLTSAP